MPPKKDVVSKNGMVDYYKVMPRKFLLQSHKILISIMKQEQKYLNNIKSINEGNCLPSSDSSIESEEVELKNRIDNI